MTILHQSPIFGPVKSRRLGISLGINVMPGDGKWCSFDCVYCECGWNQPVSHPVLPTRKQVSEALTSQLSTLNTPLDVITFSGNGEPTLHPEFLGIIEDTCALRDQYCPNAKISVLSNSTQLGRPEVIEALRLCDNRILKLDSAIDATMQLIDQPVNPNLTVEQIAQWLSLFEGDFTLQTCFLRGEYHGQIIDNTTPAELSAWYAMIKRLHPKQVMIYVIDRATPLQTLSKVPASEMEAIAEPLRQQGIDVIVCA